MEYPRRSHPELLSHYFFQLTVQAPDKSQALSTPLCKGSGHREEKRLQEGGCLWGTPQQETQRAGVFSKVFQLRGSTHCSALGLAELWEGRHGSGDVDPPQGVLQWGLHADTTSPTASTPPCPALASGLFKLQKSVTRPGAQDLMEITLAFCFFF